MDFQDESQGRSTSSSSSSPSLFLLPPPFLLPPLYLCMKLGVGALGDCHGIHGGRGVPALTLDSPWSQDNINQTKIF